MLTVAKGGVVVATQALAANTGRFEPGREMTLLADHRNLYQVVGEIERVALQRTAEIPDLTTAD